MGLFQDTIRDAHRPLGGGLLRRAVDAQADVPVEDPEPMAAEEPASGMQTIFRFQKEGAPVSMPGPPQASSRPQVGNVRPSSGDPLSASAEVESPTRIAPGDRDNVIPTTFDRSNGNLETRQPERLSPGEAAAAHASARSTTYQPVFPSVPEDKVFSRPVLDSAVMSGSELNARRGNDSFESRESGRDAPSESSLSAPPVAAPASEPAPAVASPGARDRVSSPGAGAPDSLEASLPSADSALSSAAQGVSAAVTGRPRPAPTSHHVPISSPLTRAPLGAHPLPGPGPRPGPLGRAEPTPEPRLVIGRIDVVVTATTPPVTAPADSGGNQRGFLSRNYLKRL